MLCRPKLKMFVYVNEGYVVVLKKYFDVVTSEHEQGRGKKMSAL